MLGNTIEPFVFRLDGPYGHAITPGTFDSPMLVTSARRFKRVWLMRRKGGAAGTTRVGVQVNGTNLFEFPVSEPQVTSPMGDNAVATSETFNEWFVNLVPGDMVDVVLNEVESSPRADAPEGLCVVIEFEPVS